MIIASGKIAEEVMVQLCQRVLDGKEICMNGKPALWSQSLWEKDM